MIFENNRIEKPNPNLNSKDFVGFEYRGKLPRGWYRKPSTINPRVYGYILVAEDVGRKSVIGCSGGLQSMWCICDASNPDWFGPWERCPNQDVKITF